MSLTHGMDPGRVREVAGRMKVVANSTREVREGADSTVSDLSQVWEGADLEQFTSDWGVHARTLDHVGDQLQQFADLLEKQAGEQEEASGGGGAGGSSGGRGPSLLDRLRQAGEDLLEGVDDVIDTVGDAVSDGIDWVGDRLSDLWDGAKDFWNEQVVTRWNAGMAALERLGPSLANIGRQFTQIFTEGRWPRFGEAVTSATLLLGRVGGVLANVVTGEDQGIFAHGTGGVDPGGREVPIGDGRGQQPVPATLPDLINSINETYDGQRPGENRNIRITEVTTTDANGNPRTAYIVNVPGTDGLGEFPGSITGSDNPFDNTSNLELQAGERSASMEAVEAAMREAGIPPGAPVLLNGHSQGGMVTSALLQDPAFRERYNVTHMITEGSPNDSRQVPAGVNYLALEHTNDAVPKLDFGDALLGPVPNPFPLGPPVLPGPIPHPTTDLQGSPGNVTQVRLDPPPGVTMTGGSAQNAHHYDNYDVSIRRELANGNPQLTSYANDPGLSVFMTDDPSRVRSREYQSHRRP